MASGVSFDSLDRKRHLSVIKTNQDIADRVNRNLPIRINIEDVETNPQFVKLLTSLSQHLTEDGMSKNSHNDLKEAEGKLKHEKMHWLQQQTVYSELHELLLDQQIYATESNSQLPNAQFYETASQCVSVAEIEDYLDCHPEPGTGITLLGLKKEDIRRRNPNLKYTQSLQQKLIPELESRLRKKCETIVSFHDSSAADTTSNTLMFAKASQLPAVLEAETQRHDEEKIQLRNDTVARNKQFKQYYESLMETLGVLEKLITEHRLKSKPESDTVTSEWLTARCDAMCLKIRSLEMWLLCDTYYDETVRALSSIRSELDTTIEGTEKELNQVGQSLNAYAAVGDQFENLVREYTILKDEIENKKWALRELKHSLDTSLPGS